MRARARRHSVPPATWAVTTLVLLVAACSSANGGSTATDATLPADSDPASTEPATPVSTPDPTAGPTSIASTIPPTSTAAAAPPTTATATTATAATPTAAPAPPSDAPPSDDMAAGYPAQDPDVPYPTEEWPVGALPQGIDVAVLDAAVTKAFGAPDAEARVRSLVVVLEGEIVYERYHPLDAPDQATSSFSVAKSFTSAIIGMLIGEDRLELDAPAPVPEWQAPGDPRREITIEDLLRMSSGLAWDENFEPGSDVLQMITSPHAADVPISHELVAAPGTQFAYSTGTSAILADIAADELGGGDALDAYVHRRLLDPLGMTSTVLLEDSTGTWLGGLGADSTPRDFAKFGLLYLRDGMWDGERILPAGWVDASRSPSPTNPIYGLHWWMNGPEGTFAAQGLFGQQIIVSPELDLVIVTTSTNGGDPYTLAAAVHDAFASS